VPQSKARRPRAPSRDAQRTYARIVRESIAAWAWLEKRGVPAPHAKFPLLVNLYLAGEDAYRRRPARGRRKQFMFGARLYAIQTTNFGRIRILDLPSRCLLIQGPPFAVDWAW
jgi:hypothetical protein